MRQVDKKKHENNYKQAGKIKFPLTFNKINKINLQKISGTTIAI